MITSRISRQAIFRGVLCLILLTGFCFDGFAKDAFEDIQARNQLLEKYKGCKLIKARLETILLTGLRGESLLPKLRDESREEVNKFFNAPGDIAGQKSTKATEALVDLLDFHIGERVDLTIRRLISVRGNEAILSLKRKISQKPLSFEQNVEERNKVIAELIKAIAGGAIYLDEVGGLSKEEIVRSILFYAQMDLEKYYCKKGYYPKELSEADPNVGYLEREIIHQKLYYKSYGLIYFLCALGEDGKFGTKDDVKPPYNTEVFSFPENFKE